MSSIVAFLLSSETPAAVKHASHPKGYGLDYRAKYRSLPFVGVLDAKESWKASAPSNLASALRPRDPLAQRRQLPPASTLGLITWGTFRRINPEMPLSIPWT